MDDSGTFSMSGTVHSGSATGPALAGATVAIAGQTTTTSGTGTFSIAGIAAGTYPLTISKTGYTTYTNPAYLINANQADLTFYLMQPTTYSMSGRVRSGSATGRVLAGATVAIAGHASTTGLLGAFSITGIAAGTYTLTISKTGYNTYTNPAYLINANQSGLTFYLTPGVGPAAPSNLLAVALSATTSTMSWSDNSNNETGFKVERKTGAGGTYGQIGTQNANLNFFNDSGLTPATTYCYRVRATNGSGDSGYSNESCITTPR
jgi:hypothetical protein